MEEALTEVVRLPYWPRTRGEPHDSVGLRVLGRGAQEGENSANGSGVAGVMTTEPSRWASLVCLYPNEEG